MQFLAKPSGEELTVVIIVNDSYHLKLCLIITKRATAKERGRDYLLKRVEEKQLFLSFFARLLLKELPENIFIKKENSLSNGFS